MSLTQQISKQVHYHSIRLQVELARRQKHFLVSRKTILHIKPTKKIFFSTQKYPCHVLGTLSMQLHTHS